MINFLRNGLVFLLMTFGVYSLVMAICFYVSISGTPLIYRSSEALHWYGGDTQRKFAEFDRDKEYDVIVLGSSRAYRGYDPRVFKANGLAMYNLGTHAQGISNTYFVAKEYLNPKKHKLVLLDVHLGSFISDGLESTSDLIANVESTKVAFNVAWNQADIRCLNMLGVRFFNQWSEPLYEEENYVEGGYVFHTGKKQESFEYKNYYKKNTMMESHLHHFKALLEFCKMEQIKIGLVMHPLPKEVSKERFHPFIEKMKAYQKEYDIPIYNYYFNHGLSIDKHFYDISHLNEAGASIFCKTLIQDIKKSYPELN